MTIFAAGFLAWAGVVWTRSSDIISQQGSVMLQQGLTKADVMWLRSAIDAHLDIEAHETAARRLDLLEHRVRWLEAQHAGSGPL